MTFDAVDIIGTKRDTSITCPAVCEQDVLGIGTLRQPFFDGPTGPTLTPPDAANAGPAQASEPGIFQRFWNGVVDVVNSYFAYKIDYDARFLGYVGTVGEATHKYQNEIDALAMTPMVTPSGIAGKAAQGVEVVAEEAALLAKEADALALRRRVAPCDPLESLK